MRYGCSQARLWVVMEGLWNQDGVNAVMQRDRNVTQFVCKHVSVWAFVAGEVERRLAGAVT